MKRNELKAIVKECLIEILQEGLGGVSLRESRAVPRDEFEQDSLRTIASGMARRKQAVKNERFERTVDATAASLTGNPLLQEILGDTARTTLQEQLQQDRTPSAMRSMAPVAEGPASLGAGDPAGIDLGAFENLGADAGAWSHLAFSSKPK